MSKNSMKSAMRSMENDRTKSKGTTVTGMGMKKMGGAGQGTNKPSMTLKNPFNGATPKASKVPGTKPVGSTKAGMTLKNPFSAKSVARFHARKGK